MASAPISSLLGAPADNPTPNSNANSNQLGAAPSEQMFLQLLVSQLQNQDPLNPTDSTQFVGQLAQFSQLEQLISMHSDLDTIAAATPSATNSAATNSGATTGSTSGTNTNSTSPTTSGANTSANTQN